MEYQTQGEGSAYAQLRELGGSDYEIRDGEPDIRGWDVKDEQGNELGEVDELLFDPKALKVRYIILDSRDADRKVLIPIGLAQLHTNEDEVILPGINTLQLNQLNAYKGWEEMTEEVESTDRIVFDPGYDRGYQYPDFYDHSHFDDDRFYNRGAERSDGDTSRYVSRANKSAADTASVLSDLVAILNDRVEGYERAKKELDGKEADLNDLCLELIDESRALRLQLGQELTALSKDTDTDTTAQGKIYRVWMDLKSAFTGGGRHAVLAACEYGEDAAQKAYKAALAEEGLPAYIRELIESQKQTLRASHDRVKALRDAAEKD